MAHVRVIFVAVLSVSAGAARSMNITLSVPFPGNKRASGAECQSWWGSFAICSQNLQFKLPDPRT